MCLCVHVHLYQHALVLFCLQINPNGIFKLSSNAVSVLNDHYRELITFKGFQFNIKSIYIKMDIAH